MYKNGKEYDIIPGEDANSATWDIRILEGMYTETVIRYNNIMISEETDPETGDGFLKFDYNIISSPQDDLTEDDPGLVEVVQNVMESILHMTVEHLEKSEKGS